MSLPTVWLGEGGLVHVDYQDVGVLDLAAVTAEFEARRPLAPGPQLVVARLPGVWRVDPEAAAFLASPEVAMRTRAQACVIDSSHGLAALRVLEQYQPPAFPFRVFGTLEDAAEWLLGLAGDGDPIRSQDNPVLRTRF